MVDLPFPIPFRKNPPIFVPADFNAPVAWGLDAAFPILAKTALNLEGVDVDPDDRKLLRSLRHGRLLYMSNHPTFIEPPIAYYVANVMGARFRYMASRTIFNWYGGVLGELIKRVGAFSVLAGAADREAIKAARQVLGRSDGKLVIYPEGMMTGVNDDLIPFQPGAVQIGFWGLEDARKRDANATLPVLPAFVKYVMSGSADRHRRDIERGIRRIEDELAQRFGPDERSAFVESRPKGLLRRFLTVGRVLLEQGELMYKISIASKTDYEYRMGRVRHAALEEGARIMGIELDSKTDAITRIRELFTAIETAEWGYTGPTKYHVDPESVAAAKKHVDRAYLFLIKKPRHLIQHPTAERFYEWLNLYENLTFGEQKLRPRRGRVIFAQPFDLGDYYTAYKQDRRGAVAEVNARLRGEMEALMQSAVNFTQPIAEPYDVGEDLAFYRPQ